MTDVVNRFTENQTKLEFNVPPTFSTIEAERQHARSVWLAHCASLASWAFPRAWPGTSRPGTRTAGPLLGQPFGMNFRHIRVSDLILVNHEGQVVEGKRPVNRAAFVIHAPCTPRGPTSSPRRTPTRSTAKRSLHSDENSTRSPKTPAFSSRITLSSPMVAGASCSTRRVAEFWPRAWAIRRPPFIKITVSSPLVSRSTKRRGGSSRWSERAKPAVGRGGRHTDSRERRRRALHL